MKNRVWGSYIQETSYYCIATKKNCGTNKNYYTRSSSLRSHKVASCGLRGEMSVSNCSSDMMTGEGGSGGLPNCTGSPNVIQLLVIPIFVLSLLGNVATIAIVSLFRERKVPDVLVLGLAITDLLATLIPVPMSIYAYLTVMDFPEGSAACNSYATIAQFTRYSSVLITTVIAVERYLAICKPFFYRRHCTPLRFGVVLIFSWAAAFVLALVPAVDPNTRISTHNGFCLFDFASKYSIAVVLYGGVLFIVMLICFIFVTVALIKHKYRYNSLKRPSVRRTFSNDGGARSSSPKQTNRTTPRLVSQFSDVGRSLKRAASSIQFGVEIQFLWMFTAVVALFYISWLPIVVRDKYAAVWL